MSSDVTLSVDWSIHPGRLAGVYTVENGSGTPIALWTALGRVRLDGTLSHDDPDWAFVEVEQDVLHLRRMAIAGWTKAPAPGRLPPDLHLLDAGAARTDEIALPIPVPEKQPLRRAALLAEAPKGADVCPCEPAQVTSLALSIGFVALNAALARQLSPLGPAYPEVWRTGRGKILVELQEVLHDRVALSQPLEVRRYGIVT
jgi:hypothetical protein